MELPGAQRVGLEDLSFRGDITSHVHGKESWMDAAAKLHKSVTETCWEWKDLLTPEQLTPQQDTNSVGRSNMEFRGQYSYTPPGWCHKEGSVPTKKDCICGMGEGPSTGIQAAVPLALFPEPQSLISSHMILVYSIFSLPEARVNGCEQALLHWPFNKAPVSLPDGQNPHFFS